MTGAGRQKLFLAAAAWTLIIGGCGGGGNDTPPIGNPPLLSVGPDTCIAGSAGGFPCSGISLRKRVSLSAMGGTGGNDIWGWFDTQTGNEYALMGMREGIAFVDISAPSSPIFLGTLPTQTDLSPPYGEHPPVAAVASPSRIRVELPAPSNYPTLAPSVRAF